MPKEKAIVVANCQSGPVRSLLSAVESFDSRFYFENYPPVHLMTEADVRRLHASIQTAKLCVLQYIMESYRNLGLGTKTLQGLMPEGAVSITFPSIYFSGYHPEIFYLESYDKRFLNPPPYHNRVFYYCYKNRYTIEKT